jgi:hypothetical protein
MTVLVNDIILNLQDEGSEKIRRVPLSTLLHEKNSVMLYIVLPNTSINLNLNQNDINNIVLVADEMDK